MTPDLSAAVWRKSSWSGGEGGNCVEVHPAGAVRDSKNPDVQLRVPFGDLVTAVKSDQMDR